MHSKSSSNQSNSFLSSLQTKAKCNIPFWELEFHLWNKFGYGDLVLGEEILNKSKIDQFYSLKKNAEIIFNVAEEIGFSAVTIPGNYWELAPGKPSYFWLPDELIFEQAKVLIDNCPDELSLVVTVGGVLSIPSSENYMDFSIKMMEAPEEIDLLAKQTFNQSIKKIISYSDLGYKYFLTASDLADNSGPYFPKNEFKRFILPYLKRWSHFIHNLGGYSILHSDGNLNQYMDDISDSGIDALQAIDPIAGMAMNEMLETVGIKITLCGNLDCGFLLTSDEQSIYEKTFNMLAEYHQKGEFVFGASNAIQFEIAKSNYLSMVNAWNDFNKKLIEN